MPNDTPQTIEPLPLPTSPSDTALELVRVQKRLESLNETLDMCFDVALNKIECGLAAFDSEQRLIRCNGRYAEIFGLPERLKRPGTSFVDIARRLEVQEFDRAESDQSTHQNNWIEDRASALARGEAFSCTQRLRDGRAVRVTSQPLSDGGSLDIQEYVSDRRRPEHTIKWLADYDPLTEVANSMHFSQELEHALHQLTLGTAFALHWIDLDQFGEINGKFGRPIGDAVLRGVAERLAKCVRKHDLVARLGGDEFAIIQPGVKSQEEAERLTKRLLRAISEPSRVLGHEISTSASIGVVLAPEHGTSSLELIKNVYLALYAAKAAGRDTHRIFETRRSDGPVERCDVRASPTNPPPNE